MYSRVIFEFLSQLKFLRKKIVNKQFFPNHAFSCLFTPSGHWRSYLSYVLIAFFVSDTVDLDLSLIAFFVFCLDRGKLEIKRK